MDDAMLVSLMALAVASGVNYPTTWRIDDDATREQGTSATTQELADKVQRRAVETPLTQNLSA